MRPAAPGSQVGGYRIEWLAGRGGMGEVYRALDTRLERPVALKLLAPERADDQRFRERILRESRLAAGLDHPNVVPIYEAGEAEGRLFIAMRYVEGTDLKALLRRTGVLPPERAIGLAAQLADALDAAHARGLVHRDVKPSNVLIDDPGGRDHIYLADFGLTQSASDRGPADGQLMGTIDYVAPEQIRGEQVDGRADQYALGCLLYECLTGTLPFAGGSDVATIFAHLEEEAPPPSSVRPELPVELDTVLAQALAKEPDERYGSCRAFVAAAQEALGLDVGRERLPRRAATALAGLAAVLAVVAIALLLTDGDESAGAAPGGWVVRIDPSSNAVTRRHPVPSAPGTIAVGAGRVWTAGLRDGTVWRLSLGSGEVVRQPSVGRARDLAYHKGRLYVSAEGPELFESNVIAYDAASGAREDGVAIDACRLTLAAAPGAGVWTSGCPSVVRLRTGERDLGISQRLTLPYEEPTTAANMRWCQCDIAIGSGAVWAVGDAADPRVWQIDPERARVIREVRLPFAVRSVAAADGAVWVTSPLADLIGRVDARTGRLTDTLRVGRVASGVAAGGGAVWVANHLDGTVSRLDAQRREVTKTIEVGGRPTEVTLAGGAVWVSVDGS
ncbi:MAG: protein kinase domain-containing protein [Thermoleophilaceae bacterium]